MGEYIKNRSTGEEVKIGVLDHCFFSRQQIEAWHNDPHWVGWYGDKAENGTLEYYLNNPNSLYDKIEGLRHKDFAIEIIVDDQTAIEHDKVYIWQHGKRGNGYQYEVECQFKGQTEIWATIAGERYDEKGEGRTIFACDCCGALFNMPQSLLDKSLELMDKDMREYLKPILKANKGGETS